MSSNVLPSAPHEESSLYQQLSQYDFRMQKANEVSAALNAEVAHYRGVAKKYKRAKKVANWSADSSSIISTAFSSASLGPLSLLWVFRRQFRWVTLVEHLLQLLQG